MDGEVEIEHAGVRYSAAYTDFGDSVTVLLPNGEQRTTDLGTLKAEQAAKAHLRVYVCSLTRPKRKE